MENKCKFCGSKIKIVEGRRKREFCNSNCRNKFYYKQSRVGVKPKPKGRPPKKNKEDAEKIQPEIKETVKTALDDIDKKHEPRTEYTQKEKDIMIERILQLQREIDNPAKDPPMGQLKWIAIRKEELKQLTQKLS